MPNFLLGAAEPGPVLKLVVYIKNSDEVLGRLNGLVG